MLKDTNPKDAVGVRKWRQYCTVPITIIWELGVAMLEGARKYGRHNYRVAGVRASVYVDAAKGHIDSWWEGEDIDEDSGLSHITKAMASLAVLRDAMLNDLVTDDRPPKVKNFYQFRADMQKAVESIMERHPDAKEPFTELGQRAVREAAGVVLGAKAARSSADEMAACLKAAYGLPTTRMDITARREKLEGITVGKAWVDEAATWNATEADFVDQAILSNTKARPYVVAHRDLGIEFVHPDDPEFDQMHVYGGLTTKQLCLLVMAEAAPGQGCGMNLASKTGNLTIHRPDVFDELLRRVTVRLTCQDTYECRLDFADGGFRECSTRLSADDWFIACPGVRVTPRPKRSMMKPKDGATGGGTGC